MMVLPIWHQINLGGGFESIIFVLVWARCSQTGPRLDRHASTMYYWLGLVVNPTMIAWVFSSSSSS
jgi:hypothetical protein